MDRPLRIVAATASVSVENYRPADGPSITAALSAALRGAFEAASAAPSEPKRGR